MARGSIAKLDPEKPIAVLGQGSWGATLAWLYARESKLSVRLWGRDPEKIERIRKQGYFETPLRVDIPDLLTLEDDLGRALAGVSLIILACNSQSMRELTSRVKEVIGGLDEPPVLLNVAKGLEAGTMARMSEVIGETISEAPVASLSGPNLAYEIRSLLPCASVVASNERSTAEAVQHLLSNRRLRLYVSDDVAGVELGGALKNVIAIAAGATDGLELGINAKAALLTRGLKEMTRLSVKLGARESTLFGLSGMGDLFATCQGNLSRNYRIGYYLARGNNLAEATAMVGAVAEGVSTTRVICQLAEKRGLELPIAGQVLHVLDGRVSCEESIGALMSRPLAAE